jgi:hypothetical protein
MSDIIETPIADLVVDARCQARERMSGETVEEYADLYRAEEPLPPLEVFDVDGALVVVDGFHRLDAAFRAAGSLAGVATLPVKVVGHGSMEDAVWYALGTNQRHGLKRSRADKRKAVRMALELDMDRSDREIARQAGVSHTMVSRARRGEQLRLAEVAADPEELLREADTDFQSGNFERARVFYEKASAVSECAPKALTRATEGMRQCRQAMAPLKRADRIRAARVDARCTLCGLDACAEIVMFWTTLNICPECLDLTGNASAVHAEAAE